MKRRICAGVVMVAACAAASVLVPAPFAGARETMRERLRDRIAERLGADNAAKVPGHETISYGRDPLQALDVWRAKGAAGPAPLIVFVHGGGWKRGDKDNATGRFKAVHYPGQGYVFASINYRLVPTATVEQQAADVASAVRALIDRAGSLGIDRRRIVLMGHSAGAHLVALVGTDPRYLRGAGLSFADIAGVIPIDGAAYDVAAQMQDGPPIMQQTYAQAFGTDPLRQKALSPTQHAAAPNARQFLLLYVQRADGVRQAKALGDALEQGGSRVEHGSFPGEGLKGHAEINRRLGDPAYAPTGFVDDWLRRVFAR
ncbi:alpha/beta hydrolase [Sphingopyxis sp. LK2115]|jgi:acetyl esterase/lipase|uniref:alpha/beta hydrolase n=1 Tax=Sphingopyxis sp. LK2115 TaxID=2744558 RepID=UPI0016602759|nr:alpha/beta hydrolase [Sphingopyxis sp. LK2115]